MKKLTIFILLLLTAYCGNGKAKENKANSSLYFMTLGSGPGSTKPNEVFSECGFTSTALARTVMSKVSEALTSDNLLFFTKDDPTGYSTVIVKATLSAGQSLEFDGLTGTPLVNMYSSLSCPVNIDVVNNVTTTAFTTVTAGKSYRANVSGTYSVLVIYTTGTAPTSATVKK